MSEKAETRQGRINMRVNEGQERLLRAAAELSGESLTGFVLMAATERARDVLERAEHLELSAKAFQQFVAALDEPSEEMPVLRRYARRRSAIPAK